MRDQIMSMTVAVECDRFFFVAVDVKNKHMCHCHLTLESQSSETRAPGLIGVFGFSTTAQSVSLSCLNVTCFLNLNRFRHFIELFERK